jgi:hypothetical protein
MKVTPGKNTFKRYKEAKDAEKGKKTIESVRVSNLTQNTSRNISPMIMKRSSKKLSPRKQMLNSKIKEFSKTLDNQNSYKKSKTRVSNVSINKIEFSPVKQL